MSVNLAACVTSFLVSFIILPVIIKYSLRKNLVDTPSRRKIHTKITPSLGGIAIFIGFLIASLIWMDFGEWRNLRYVLASLFIVFLLGVRDDLVPFRAVQKLSGQLGAITFEYPPRCLRIRKDGSQWMVKLVRHRSRHLSQQGKIRRLLGLVPQPARLYRGALSRQGIAENVSNDS